MAVPVMEVSLAGEVTPRRVSGRAMPLFTSEVGVGREQEKISTQFELFLQLC